MSLSFFTLLCIRKKLPVAGSAGESTGISKGGKEKMLRTDLPKIITETVPGPKAQALIDRRKAATPSAIGCAYPVAIARGEGAMIEDLDGNKFLDWIGGVGVLNIGYSQPEVVEAVKEQADNYFHGMFNIVTHEGYVALAEKLSEIAPVKGDKKKAFFANSGAEADENAVKVAKAFTKRNNIIVFSGAFHGRTLLTMSMTSKKAYAIGMGPFLMHAASCIVTMFINQQLLKYGGDLAIGAYGIVNRISFLFVMVNMGFNQGMQPIAGYNYGARKYTRVKQVYKLTVTCATVVTCAGFLVSECIPGFAVSLFTNDPELKALAVKGLRIINLAFPLVGFQMVATNFFQCLGMVHKSILLSLSRQLLFLVPMIYFLPLFFGYNGVWMSFPVADSLSIILSTTLLVMLFRKFRKLNDGDDPSILGSKI